MNSSFTFSEHVTTDGTVHEPKGAYSGDLTLPITLGCQTNRSRPVLSLLPWYHKVLYVSKVIHVLLTEVRFSRHARKRMVERGISEKEVVEAIRKGRKRTQDNKIISSYSYLEVAYRKINNTNYVITVKPRW